MPNSAKDPNIYIWIISCKICQNVSNIDTGIHNTIHKYICTKLLIMQQNLFVAYITTLKMHFDS